MAIPAVRAAQHIARPLRVLIPLIQSELQQGNSAGRGHYTQAGRMLIEAKDQVGHGGWVKWLTKNFELSRQTANVYMRWARLHNNLEDGGLQIPPTSFRQMSTHQIPNDLPSAYPPRRREYAYCIVREPGSFVLFKAFNDNCGTVRLLEFADLKKALAFVETLPQARVVLL